MPYSDIINAINQYGSVYNYGEVEGSVNPYSSQAYTPTNYREIISRKTAPVDPRSAFTDYKPGWEQSLATGTMGLQVGSNLKFSPKTQMGVTNFLGNSDKAIGDFKGGNLGASLALYGATRDGNPYNLSTGETIGNIAAPAMAGFKMGGAPGLFVGLLAGLVMNKKQQNKVDTLNTEAKEQFDEDRKEYREAIEDEFVEGKEAALKQREATLWAADSSKYSNQYGAYANPYGQSYYDKGGKMKLYNGGGGMEGGYEDPYVWGCMDSVAFNYNPQATMDDGSCIFLEEQITPNVENLNPDQLSDEQLDMVTEWGTTWLPSIERAPYEPPILRLTKEKVPISEDKIKVVDPFKNELGQASDKNGDSTQGLEAYRWDLENPYIRENVDIFNKGGKIMAEFTGNELIVNNQTEVEEGVKSGNAKRAAAPIRRALKARYITPGEETHNGNPMPVNNKGQIMTNKGVLPFKVRKGAGVYDHATDQFKESMTDEQIMAIIKKNIAKWESNNMN